jgi:hypothetical protein
MTFDATTLKSLVEDVTKLWTRQRRAEERGSRSKFSRDSIFDTGLHEPRTFLAAANDILPRAYQHASGGGEYPASKRQLYYACREEFKQVVGKELNSNYFSNTLLVQYLNRHPKQAATWKITADARGTLTIPNTAHDLSIPCGTLEMNEFTEEMRGPFDPMEIELLPPEWPVNKPGERFQGLIYIEKEGFDELLNPLAARYDLAVISCKGQSVVAARRFIDEFCSEHDGVPLLVIHDFDKSGFEIAQRLTTVSELAEQTDRVAYHFRNKIRVIDLGLRLSDVQEYQLPAETVDFKGYFASDTITTADEQAFLRSGQRVELNAFTSPQFIEWVERKFHEHGLGTRLIPKDDILPNAYRRAFVLGRANDAIQKALEEASDAAVKLTIPKALRTKIRKRMKERGESWDRALYGIVRSETTAGTRNN